jgi:hypothetical protein
MCQAGQLAVTFDVRQQLCVGLVVLAQAVTSVGCTDRSVEGLLVTERAEEIVRVQRQGGTVRQVSYVADVTYPETAISERQFSLLVESGWSKCAGYEEGWEIRVEADGRFNRTVFEVTSHWFKRGELLTVVQHYYGIAKPGLSPAIAPTSARLHVKLMFDKNPDTPQFLGITCK